MVKVVSVALLAAGILFLVVGVNSYNSSDSDTARLFTGSATYKALWMLIGGGVGAALGLVGLLSVWRRD